MKELKKVRKLLIAKIQLVDNESDETDDDNLRTLDTLSLLKKYEKVSFRHYSKNSKSSERDEILEKLESQVAKLKAKNEKLKTRASQSDNGSLTLKKLQELQDALKIQATLNEPEKNELLDKINQGKEALADCKSKLDLLRQISGMYEEQQQVIMDILKKDRSFTKCLNELEFLQEKISNSGIQERNEVILYENAMVALEAPTNA